MYEAMFIAATGIRGQQQRIDTIANNVANVNTIGYKTSRLDFKDALYTAGLVPGPPYTPDGNQQKGHGVIMAAISNIFTPGSLQATENMLDFALVGDGFFELTDPAGNAVYTRAGNFYATNGPDGAYLVNSKGYFVMNADGQRIRVPEGTTKVEVSEEGVLTFRGDGVLGTDRFGIYAFDNKTGLSLTGGTNYETTVASGERRPAADVIVKQHMLEGSNVDMANEMTLLIRASRAFSLAGKALTTADDMEGIANNMRR